MIEIGYSYGYTHVIFASRTRVRLTFFFTGLYSPRLICRQPSVGAQWLLKTLTEHSQLHLGKALGRAQLTPALYHAQAMEHEY